MVYPYTQEHSSPSKKKITTTAHRTGGQTRSRTTWASGWLQTQRAETLKQHEPQEAPTRHFSTTSRLGPGRLNQVWLKPGSTVY